MALGSDISWLRAPGTAASATVNDVMGCDPVTEEECGRCWAPGQVVRQQHLPGRAGLTARDALGRLTWSGRVVILPARILEPLSWPVPTTMFWTAMGDLFHPAVPRQHVIDQWAVKSLTPWHIHINLTKRARNLQRILADPAFPEQVEQARQRLAAEHPAAARALARYPTWQYPVPNVIVGVSAGTQATADLRIPYLLNTPAAVRAASVEPQSALVRLWRWLGGEVPVGIFEGVDGWENIDGGGINWVIVGGESGNPDKVARLDPAWVDILLDECRAEGAAFHFKQLGNALAREMGATGKGHDPAEWPAWMRVREYPEVRRVVPA